MVALPPPPHIRHTHKHSHLQEQPPRHQHARRRHVVDAPPVEVRRRGAVESPEVRRRGVAPHDAAGLHDPARGVDEQRPDQADGAAAAGGGGAGAAGLGGGKQRLEPAARDKGVVVLLWIGAVGQWRRWCGLRMSGALKEARRRRATAR